MAKKTKDAAEAAVETAVAAAGADLSAEAQAEAEHLRLALEQAEDLLAAAQAALAVEKERADALQAALTEQGGVRGGDGRESVWVRSALPLWRGGVCFDGEWREVKRGEVGETAWLRILSEPAFQFRDDAP